MFTNPVASNLPFNSTFPTSQRAKETSTPLNENVFPSGPFMALMKENVTKQITPGELFHRFRAKNN